MAYLIGMDEAGYGPNLGPLVIAATVWRVEESRPRDLYDTLAAGVTRDATEARAKNRLAIADSKELYQPQRGIADLERGVLASLLAMGEPLPRVGDLLSTVVRQAADNAIEHFPWHANQDESLPIACDPDDCRAAGERFRETLAAAECKLLRIAAAVVQPDAFNELVDRHDGKGAALSETTLNLLASLLGELRDDCVFVTCDKHGGRNRYLDLLHGRFGDHLVEVRCEGRERSTYRWGEPSRRVEISFRTGGEAFLPAALASMTAKYLRELSMRAFNAFWQTELPALRPTAGYPVDARRFKSEIADVQRRLGIADRVLWRNR
jgi:hypothetical protein